MESGKWVCSLDKTAEMWHATEAFDTKEDAIEEGRKILKALMKDRKADTNMEDVFGDYIDTDSSIPSSFAVGKTFNASKFPSVDSILENLADDAYQECGEVAESWLADVTDEHKDVLQKKLNIVMANWMDEYHYNPEFNGIDNIELVQVF